MSVLAIGAFLSLPQEASAVCPPNTVNLYTDELAGETDLAVTESITFVDLDGDSEDDLCFVDNASVICYTHNNEVCSSSSCTETNLTCGIGDQRYIATFPFYIDSPQYAHTVGFADVDGNGFDDVCLRGPSGVYCARNFGAGFIAPSKFTTAYADSSGWDDPEHYETVKFKDVDNDGRADICGRGNNGIYCSFSGGSSFGGAQLMTQSGQFSDAGDPSTDATSWNTSATHYETIDFIDIDGDDRLDVCGRGSGGIFCALMNSTQRQFNSGSYWLTSQFKDSQVWYSAAYGSTVQFGDINNDGRADVCGRWSDGVHCAVANGWFQQFFTSSSVVTAFSNANGWGVERHFSSIVLSDVDGDGKDDVCGRGWDGIFCALSESTYWEPAFDTAGLWIANFGDNYGWGSERRLWGTVQPADVDDDESGTEFCGLGYSGIYCSVD